MKDLPQDDVANAEEMLACSVDEFRARIPTSMLLEEQASETLALEVVQTVDFDCPVYIERADGCRLTDVDGNNYIDLTMGFGAHVLGLRAPSIESAIKHQAWKGWHFGIHNKKQYELAHLIADARPNNEQIAFCNSGTEATMYAFRLARAKTGKSKIGVFDGAYHGAHDYALVKVDPHSDVKRPRAVLDGAGIPSWVRDDSAVALPYCHPSAFDLIRAHKDDLALICVQPVQNNNPSLAHKAWLAELIEVCRNCDVLCLFDEVVSGFRLAYGGAQEVFDLTPDFTVYGKSIGGGLPIGAIAGPRSIMGGFKSVSTDTGVFFGGTFNGNPLTMAAGVGALSTLSKHRTSIYPTLNARSDRMVQDINAFAQAEGFPFQAVNAGSLICFHFQNEPICTFRDLNNRGSIAERAFYVQLLNYGVIVPAIHLAFLSHAHTDTDVAMIVDAVKASLFAIRDMDLI